MMMKKVKAATGNKYFSLLPTELCSEILSWLPVTSVGRCKCVCKSWRDMINDPNFNKLHFDRRSVETHYYSNTTRLIMFTPYRKPPLKRISSFNVNDYKLSNFTQLYYPTQLPTTLLYLIGCCNGLICFSSYHKTCDHRFFLYNPITGAYKHVPSTSTSTLISKDLWISSFGYDHISDDFKILLISHTEIVKYTTLLYSLKLNAWEVIENPPSSWEVDELSKSNTPILINNSFHWLGLTTSLSSARVFKTIKGFEISSRRYFEMQLPKGVYTNLPKLTVLQGQLCVVTCCLDIWILKEYGDHKSWTQILFGKVYDGLLNNFDVLQYWGRYKCISCFQNGPNNIILVITRMTPDFSTTQLEHYLICCNYESRTLEKIDISDCLKHDSCDSNLPIHAIQPWVDSLVDPDALSSLS